MFGYVCGSAEPTHLPIISPKTKGKMKATIIRQRMGLANPIASGSSISLTFDLAESVPADHAYRGWHVNALTSYRVRVPVYISYSIHASNREEMGFTETEVEDFFEKCACFGWFFISKAYRRQVKK